MLLMCLTAVAGISVAAAFLAHAAVHWLLSRGAKPRRMTIPVSILKPLKGLDDELEANLESFCNQSHPKYEIIFGAADASDPALLVARKVAESHPRLPIRIVVGECPTGLNPKVRLLRALLRSARYDVILISDSNVRVDRHYLANTAAELEDPKVALVSNPIVGSGHMSLGATLENFQLNSYVIFGLALTNFVGKFACVVGKSMLMRKSALEQIGGFGRFADILAEDYLIGRAMRQRGFRVATCKSAIQTINKNWNVGRTWQRHLRWSQIRRSLGAPGYILELLLLPHLWLFSMMGAWGIASPASLPVVFGICGVTYLLTCVSEAAATSRWSRHHGGFVRLLAFAAVRQFGQGLLWLLAWAKSDVEWRGNRLRIGKGSRLMGPQRSPKAASQTLTRQAA